MKPRGLVRIILATKNASKVETSGRLEEEVDIDWRFFTVGCATAQVALRTATIIKSSYECLQALTSGAYESVSSSHAQWSV
jgi:hypothetical protein